MSIIKKGKNIIGVYKGSTPISKIYKGGLSVFELNVVCDITATFDVTSTTEPTKIADSSALSGFTRMYVDGVEVLVTDVYTFDTLGEHTVQYELANKTTIGSSMFENCSSLTSVSIGNSVTSIGDYAFSYCSDLTSVTIGSGVTIINDSAFQNCTSLTSIVIPDSVTSIEDWAFDGCYFQSDKLVNNSSVTGYPWGATICDIIQDDGLCISETTVVKCRPNATNVTIPSTVTTIGGSAFSHCSNLTSVIIGDSVISIDDWAFEDCSSLTSITISDSVTTISDYAFFGCTSLTSIVIPDSVTSIGDWAFNDCTSLSSVTIPDSVTKVGYRAFDNTPFDNNLPNGDVYLGSCYYKYKGEMPSNTSITIRDGIKSISVSAFSNCSNLTLVIIPDSVTTIGIFAFNGCSSLTSITCYATTAPSLGSDVFKHLPINGILYVPNGSDYSSWLSSLPSGWTIEYIT